MEEANIRKYAELMEELELTGLEIGEGAGRIRLERMPAPQPVMPVMPDRPHDLPGEKEEEPRTGAFSRDEEITSPMVGIFYAAAAETEDPFVKVGDRVRKGDTLCIIEAMKLMNEILAERDGVISEICAVDGQAVEYGTVLFRIR